MLELNQFIAILQSPRRSLSLAKQETVVFITDIRAINQSYGWQSESEIDPQGFSTPEIAWERYLSWVGIIIIIIINQNVRGSELMWARALLPAIHVHMMATASFLWHNFHSKFCEFPNIYLVFGLPIFRFSYTTLSVKCFSTTPTIATWAHI